MKTKTIVILCLAVAFGLALFLLSRTQPSATERHALYLPQDTVATVSLTHLNTITDTFAATALGRFAARETMHAIMAEMRVDPAALSAYDELYDTVTTVLGNPAFRTVFGEDTALALLNPDRTRLALEPQEALRSALVVFAVTPAPGALDLFARLVMSQSVARETFDGLELTRITVDEDQVVYGYAEGQTVLLALDPAAIKICLEARGSNQALESLPVFREAVTFWGPVAATQTFVRAFINPEPLAGLLTAMKDNGLQGSEHMQGGDFITFIIRATETGLESRARYAYRYEQLGPSMKRLVDTASANQTLHLLQEGILAYNWASMPVETLFRPWFAGADTGERAAAGAQETYGVPFEELLRGLGPQRGLVLNNLGVTIFPVPKMTFFLEVREPQVAESVVRSLRDSINAYGLAREREEVVAGRTIHYWPILPGETAQPAVVRTDTMLYLANGITTLKEILTTTVPLDVLPVPVAEELGPELSERVTRANSSSLVLYPERMSRQSSDLTRWLSGILSATRNLSITRLSQELNEVMRATELIVMTADLDRERVDWDLSIKAAQAQAVGPKAD